MIATTETERPPRPVAPTVKPANIPRVLKNRSQWVLWNYTWSAKQSKWTKRPLMPNGHPASSTDPATWSDYGTALAALPRKGFNGRPQYDGLGFVLSADDPFTGIDLDHCIEDGKLTEWAQHVVNTLASYTETSPSGDGLRIFVRGKLPGGGGRKNGQIEIYDRARFLTITGQVFNHATN